MPKTPQGLLAHCREASSWKYVYGMKGSVLTSQKYYELKRMYGHMVWDSDVTKVGKMCCDCSGLISSYTGILRSSSSYELHAPESTSLDQLKANWSNYVGWALWLPGHIGVVSDSEGYYYAMDGSARNWVHYPLRKNNWKKAIKICDIEYPEIHVENDDKEGDCGAMTDLQIELFVENVLYIGLLDRKADESGKEHWCKILREGASINDVCNRFMESEEYRARTVTVAYERLLHREPEPEGLKHWTEWLKGEKTADDLYKRIMESDEYKMSDNIR